MKHGAQVGSSAIFSHVYPDTLGAAWAALEQARPVRRNATMLRLLKRWLGWDSNSGPFDFSDLRFGARSSSSPTQTQAQPRSPAAPRGEAPAQRAETPARGSAAAPAQTPKPAAPKKAKKDRAPMDLLDNPQLTLDRPTGDGFDPYNTGAFNRSASWEKIGRNKKN
jgi:hypothetical protein